MFVANFSLFIHALFMLIITNDFLNLIEIMNCVFAIEVFVFSFENRVVKEEFGKLLKFM